MNKLQHTPGPWHRQLADRYIRQYNPVAEAKGYWNESLSIAQTSYINSDEETEANARLIAAAPEMLECMLIEIKLFVQSEGVEKVKKFEMCRVIERATGLKIEEVLK